MSTDPNTWRLRQQAGQLTRLFIDAGLSGTDALDSVGRLGRHLEARAELTDEAEQLAAEVRVGSVRTFDELTRLEHHTDVFDRTLASVYRELTQVADADNRAAASSTTLLDDLQQLHD